MKLSGVLRRRLTIIAKGRDAWRAAFGGVAGAVLDGMLLERGLVRTVKHRDHTRSYAITAAGKEALEVTP